MYNINLQHLKVIDAIEKEGSMTKAAERLNLTQSSLSHHLRELENNIDAIVFERRNKRLWITEVGKKILSSSEVILYELSKLDKEIKSIKKGGGGTIRISTECYTTYSWLPKLIRDFNKNFPKVHIQIVVEATKKPIKYLQNGQLDIAITGKKKEQNPAFKYIPLFQDELVVVVNKENALANCKFISPKDLQAQTLIVYDMEDKELDLLQMVLKPKNIEPAKIIKMQLTEVIIEMIKSNLGIAVMSKKLVKPLITRSLSLVPFNDDYAHKTWQIVCHKNENLLEKGFIEFAVETFKGK